MERTELIRLLGARSVLAEPTPRRIVEEREPERFMTAFAQAVAEAETVLVCDPLPLKATVSLVARWPASETTWALVRMWPCLSTTKPEPTATLLSVAGPSNPLPVEGNVLVISTTPVASRS